MTKCNCSFAILDTEMLRYTCKETSDGCMFLVPDSKKCYQLYKEGPLSFSKEEKKIKTIKSRYLANALVWLGFKYEKNSNGDFIFERNDALDKAYNGLNDLRKALKE